MHYVKCSICGERFDRDKEPFENTSARRYAHKKCFDNKEELITKEEKERIALEKYIMQIFKIEFVTPRMKKQIKQFLEEYKYTYSGIHKSLIYFFEVKNNSIDKANNSLGIVPYVYQDAFNYYYSLWLAQEKNKNKIIEEYKPKQVVIKIKPPKKEIKKRKVFTFLD